MSEGMKKLVGFAIFGALIIAGIVGSDASDDSAVTRNAGIPGQDTIPPYDSDMPPLGDEGYNEPGDFYDQILAMLDAILEKQNTLAQQVAGLNVNQGNGDPTQEEVEQLLRDSDCTWQGQDEAQEVTGWFCYLDNGSVIPFGSNFSGANLGGASFVLLDLTGVNFSGANLAGVTFYFNDLTGVDFTKANLAGAKFGGSGAGLFVGADFTGANLAGINFTNSQLEGAIGLP